MRSVCSSDSQMASASLLSLPPSQLLPRSLTGRQQSLALALACSFSLFRSRSLSLPRSLSRSHKHTLSRSLSVFLSLCLCLSLSIYKSLSQGEGGPRRGASAARTARSRRPACGLKVWDLRFAFHLSENPQPQTPKPQELVGAELALTKGNLAFRAGV